MRYLLDTNICIYAINTKPAAVFKHLCSCKPGDVGISTITIAELRYGADKSRAIEKNHSALNQFLMPLQILEFDEAAAGAYGSISTWLEKKGTPIGPLDTLIAAHAVSTGATLVTNNTKEFRRVPGLAIEDWTR